jgi:hypothetical protein
VTLTLPDEVIETLRSIDGDLSRALVRLVQPLSRRVQVAARRLTTFGDRTAVILVAPSQSLVDHTGVELVPLADGRAMLSLDERMSVADLELRLVDTLGNPGLSFSDRSMFRELLGILRRARRAEGMAIKQRTIILLHRTSSESPGTAAGQSG